MHVFVVCASRYEIRIEPGRITSRGKNPTLKTYNVIYVLSLLLWSSPLSSLLFNVVFN